MDALRHSELSLLRRWIQARLLVTLRTPRAAFFTFVFPLLLLTLLNATSKGSTAPTWQSSSGNSARARAPMIPPASWRRWRGG